MACQRPRKPSPRRPAPIASSGCHCLEVGDAIGRVRYETAGASTAELDALLARVVADLDLLRDAGVNTTTVWTDATNGTVVVGLLTPTPEAIAILTERYGPRIRVVEHGGFHQVP